MRHGFDAFGWYTGPVADDDPRSAPTPPDNTSTTTTAGQMRANWGGRSWTTRPYAAPAADDPHIDLRAELVDRIKAERDRRKHGGTLVDGHWFHSDVDSRLQQLGLFVMGESVPAVPWRTMGGEFVTMSQALAAAIFYAVAVNDAALFARAEVLRAAVAAAADPRTVDINAGWPATFEG